jgi:hypothetical protein
MEDGGLAREWITLFEDGSGLRPFWPPTRPRKPWCGRLTRCCSAMPEYCADFRLAVRQVD